ncbi:hypothetical protein CCR75_007395 [Bremia lactucae]|uniref:Uncharacterized protein n=1 Tax=Bremia lactucae TaxID=4779 RepID=A0A976NZ25_BRELC|nr:hypothetical protein CCR75_007395 [Bremia lactucae]
MSIRNCTVYNKHKFASIRWILVATTPSTPGQHCADLEPQKLRGPFAQNSVPRHGITPYGVESLLPAFQAVTSRFRAAAMCP